MSASLSMQVLVRVLSSSGLSRKYRISIVSTPRTKEAYAIGMRGQCHLLQEMLGVRVRLRRPQLGEPALFWGIRMLEQTLTMI